MSLPRTMSQADQNLYLYPLGAWGVGLLALYFTGRAALALTLCFPLALWTGGVTLYWGVRTARQLARGEIRRPDVRAGAVSIGHLLSVSAMLPALVFLATDPLEPSAWMTAGGVMIVSLMAYGATSLMARWSNRYTYSALLTLAWLALPANATGSMSVATWLGWFDALRLTAAGT